MPSTDLVARRVSDHLLLTGKSPEEFGREINLSGMTIRRLLDRDVALRNRTKRLIAQALGEDPTRLWTESVRRKAVA